MYVASRCGVCYVWYRSRDLYTPQSDQRSLMVAAKSEISLRADITRISESGTKVATGWHPVQKVGKLAWHRYREYRDPFNAGKGKSLGEVRQL